MPVVVNCFSRVVHPLFGSVALGIPSPTPAVPATRRVAQELAFPLLAQGAGRGCA